MLKKSLIYILLLQAGFANGLQFNLLTTFYNEKDNQRKLEYKRCFLENINNKFIKKIYVFYEKPKEIEGYLRHHKVRIIPINKRPGFQQFFDYANEYLKHELVIISNTDIYFDNSLELLKEYNFRNKVLALTRYNIPEYKGRWERHNLSYDSWIFKAPLLIKTNTVIGTFGSDLVLTYRLIRSGFKVINLSLSIKSWHVHLSDARGYDKKVKVNLNEWDRIIHSIKRLLPFRAI